MLQRRADPSEERRRRLLWFTIASWCQLPSQQEVVLVRYLFGLCEKGEGPLCMMGKSHITFFWLEFRIYRMD